MTKAFSGVAVLHGVDFAVRAGTVHGLFGHNGAGKSTLLKILAGAETPDSGTLLVDGTVARLASPRDALERGIACVYQELRLIPQLTVTDNLFLGRERRGRGGLRDRAAMREHARRLLAEHGVAVDPLTRVRDLSHPDKQMIEVIANLDRRARYVLLDEPTTALDGRQAAALLARVRGLARERGLGVVLVSHKLDEVLAVCDESTVMSGGRVVLHDARGRATKADIIAAIVGDVPAHQAADASRRAPVATEPALRVADLATGRLDGVTLSARAGEVLGLYGLIGSGRTRFCRALYGLEPVLAGTVMFEGRPLAPATPAEAIDRGVAYLTEERKRDGFVPRMSALRNTVLPVLARYRRRGLLDRVRAGKAARDVLERLRARGDLLGPMQALSGGNQQKVLFARIMAQGARLILLDEPTKGVDIGAKADIYDTIRRLAEAGACVIMVSSEEEEILEAADRVVVFRNGRCDGAVRRAAELTIAELRRLAWATSSA